MLCQKCRKKNAAILYKELRGETRYELSLCESCAEEFENTELNDSCSPSFFPNRLFFDSTSDNGKERCPVCSATFSEIVLSGEIGCPTCFGVFAEALSSSVQRIHGHTQHCGRIPSWQSDRIAKEKQLSAWKNEMQKAIEAEEFELAASLRDKIRCLQNEIHSPSKHSAAQTVSDRLLSIADGINDTLSVDTALVSVYNADTALVGDIDGSLLGNIITKGA